jgi:hypothetical protein
MCVEGFEEAEIQRPTDFAVRNPSSSSSSSSSFFFIIFNV